MSGDGLPPLREVIARHGLAAKKSLGQNFLLDLNLTAKVARAAGDLTGATVVEVGPGPGGLTRSLLSLGAKRIIAVERDERCLPALAEIAEGYQGRLDVISGDALDVDWPALVEGASDVRVVANLPYNVGTELLLRWIATPHWPPFWTSLTLMFQREVAERIVARPGAEAYGRLGVLAGWRTEARIVFDIAPQAFWPPPKVTSSVVHIVPRAAPLAADLRALERVTQAAFGQRRKMLRQSLKALGGEALLGRVGIDATRRAETLTVEEFVRLANATEGDARRDSTSGDKKMQRLGVVPRLWQPLLSGEKLSTIRFNEAPVVPGPLLYVNDGDPSQTAVVTVLRVTRMKLHEAAAFLGRSDEWPPAVMLEGMREHYPAITLDDEVDVIEHTAPETPR